jgi:hypothetical protein
VIPWRLAKWVASLLLSQRLRFAPRGGWSLEKTGHNPGNRQ